MDINGSRVSDGQVRCGGFLSIACLVDGIREWGS